MFNRKTNVRLLSVLLVFSLSLWFLFPSFSVSADSVPRSGIYSPYSCNPCTFSTPENTYLSGTYETVAFSNCPTYGYYCFSTSDGELYWYEITSSATTLYKLVDDDFVESFDFSGPTPPNSYSIWKYNGELYWTYDSLTYKLVNNVWTLHNFTGLVPKSASCFEQFNGDLFYFHREDSDSPYYAYRYSDGGFYLDETFIVPPNYGGYPLWTNGTDIFYSFNNEHYRRTESGEWESVSFTGITSFTGDCIFTDGSYYYLAGYKLFGSDSKIYRLNGMSWEPFITLEGNVFYRNYFCDGRNIYLGPANSTKYKLILSENLFPSSVSSISLSSSDYSVYPGSTVTYTATVSGTGDYSTAVTWSVSGATSSGTAISDTGELTVAPDETSSTITVTATSVQDTSVFGSCALEITPFPGADELVLFPGYVTALEGVAFSQQYTISFKDGTPFEYGNPTWGAYIFTLDSGMPDLEDLPAWASISDSGVVTLTSDSVAGYRIVPYAKLGTEIITGAQLIVSDNEKDYLKDIINGSDDQKADADNFGHGVSGKFDQIQEDTDAIDQVTMPDIGNIDLDIDTQVSSEGMTAIAMLLGIFMNSQSISTSMTFAFLFALVAYVIFGKRS